MAFQVGEISAPITADMTGFNRAIDRVKSAGRQMTAMFTAPLLAAGTFAVKTAADFESLRQSMDILNGSAEEGARNFNRLKEFSARTPFQLQGLAEAQNMLQGFGMSADDAFNSISMIGDIAAVTGGDIKGIGIAFGQAAAEGKAMTRDIRQFINQGVPMIKLLADTMGVAQSEVLSLAEEGEISFDILQQAFRDATTEGGMFANGMAKQAQTISGVFSTLKDNTSIALAELGNTIVDTLNLKGIIKNLTAQIQGITQRFKEMSDESKKRILAVAGALMAGGPLLIGLGIAAKAVSGFASLVASKFTVIAGAVALGVVAIQNLSDNWGNIMSEMGRQTASWAAATQNTLSLIAKTASFFGRAMPGAMQGYFMAMDEAILTLQGLEAESGAKFTSFSESAKNAFSSVSSAMRSMLNNLSGGSLNDFLALLNGGLGNTSTGGISSPMDNIIPPDLSPEIEGLSQKIQEFEGFTVEAGEKGEIAMNRLGMGVSNIVSQLIRGRKEALSFGNIFQTLLPGILSAIPGVGGGAFFSKVFKGLFHSGGVVPGSGSKLIRARGGEGVFTPSQMAAIGNVGGGQMSESSMQKALERALGNYVRGVSDRKIFEMAEKGRYG